MQPKGANYNSNKTSLYFNKASKFLIMGGLPGYIMGQEISFRKAIIYRHLQKVLTVCLLIFVAFELGSFVTQQNLTEKQAADRWMFCFSHPLLLSYSFVIEYHKQKIRNVISKLCKDLKNIYNDLDIEQQMIRKVTTYSVVFSLSIMSALLSYGFAALLQVIRSEGTFTTVITTWPDVTDISIFASFFRVFYYFIWWILMAHVSASFFLLIITMGCLCYQYKNVQSYFYSLNKIFEVGNLEDIGLQISEVKYEDSFKVGVQLHVDTLWCTRQCQEVCSIVYSGQITLNVTVFSMLLLQMTNTHRTLSGTCTVILTGLSLLYVTGILMWNAGDVTIEAGLVSTAMYGSGWQNCRGASSLRIRKLLIIAMTQAQRTVVIRGFGIMDISYQAYVSIVKTSYSAFSFLY